MLLFQNVGYGIFIDHKLRSTHASRGNLVFIKDDNKIAVFIPVEIMLAVGCHKILPDFRVFNPIYFVTVLCHYFIHLFTELVCQNCGKIICSKQVFMFRNFGVNFIDKVESIVGITAACRRARRCRFLSVSYKNGRPGSLLIRQRL